MPPDSEKEWDMKHIHKWYNTWAELVVPIIMAFTLRFFEHNKQNNVVKGDGCAQCIVSNLAVMDITELVTKKAGTEGLPNP